MPRTIWRRRDALQQQHVLVRHGLRADGRHCRAHRSRRAGAADERRRSASAATRLVAGLNDIPGVTCTLPEGAFYAFPNVTEITHDDRALASFLLEEGGVGMRRRLVVRRRRQRVICASPTLRRSRTSTGRSSKSRRSCRDLKVNETVDLTDQRSRFASSRRSGSGSCSRALVYAADRAGAFSCFRFC